MTEGLPSVHRNADVRYYVGTLALTMDPGFWLAIFFGLLTITITSLKCRVRKIHFTGSVRQ